MSDSSLVGMMIGFTILIIAFAFEKKQTRVELGMFKTTAYHEAGHAVIAIYLGIRCYNILLNLDANDNKINKNIIPLGYASVESRFKKEMKFIYDFIRGVNLNIHLLPYSEELLDYAKKSLLIHLAGEITLKEILEMPHEQMYIISNRIAPNGDDLHRSESLVDYLQKMEYLITMESAMDEVSKIINDHKEVRAAIHFLADILMKNPGRHILENEIIDNLKMCNFFDVYKKELQ